MNKAVFFIFSLQQEDQPQSPEEESSEELEDNAQTQPLRQDRKTSCHPEARPCRKNHNIFKVIFKKL